MKRYFGKVLARFVAGVLVAGLLSWGAYASSALDPFADWTVEEFWGDNTFWPKVSTMQLREISLFMEEDGRSFVDTPESPLVKIVVEITGPQSFGARYCLGSYRRGEWYVAYSPMVFPLYGASLDPGATLPLSYEVPLQTLMGPGPFRLYAGGLGHIDIPSLRDVQWEEGSVVLD